MEIIYLYPFYVDIHGYRLFMDIHIHGNLAIVGLIVSKILAHVSVNTRVYR